MSPSSRSPSEIPAPPDNPRRYGRPPHRVVLVHGGPGAGGEMAPVARRLSRRFGVIEPIQTADSVDGQVGELADHIRHWAAFPAVLVGFSWGAWLVFILAARHPDLVGKLILVSSGPFSPQYAEGILETRLGRLDPSDRAEAESLMGSLSPPGDKDPAAFARLGALFEKADAHDPVDTDFPDLIPRPDLFHQVFPEAAAMRRDGTLPALGHEIRCPAVAIHGDADPHPAAGVEGPLATVLTDFRFILLPRCGHRPWIERHAREAFYRTLERELEPTGSHST